MRCRTTLYVLSGGVLAATVPALAIVDAGAGQAHSLTCGPGCGHEMRQGGGGGTSNYIAGDRWTATATDGSGIRRGDPITITWGLVPDGTSWINGSSDLIDFLDDNLGAGPGGSDLTQRPWFGSFVESFGRWEELSGITYVYEPNDDGRSHTTQAFGQGQLGVRADVRIGGSFRDGNSGVLASNFFPSAGGDMTLDTGDDAFYANAFSNFRALRNVLMHEHGHGLGFSHIESNNGSFLMEPFVDLSFDGPQMDDLRAIQRNYGDRFEKGLGNDTTATATFLGDANAGPLGIGLDGDTGLRIEPSEVDFVSIDGSNDLDVFSFEVDQLSLLDVTLTPEGAVYNQGAQNSGSQSSFDTRDDNDLELDIFAADGTTLLASIDDFAAGVGEAVSDLVIGRPGTYFARVRGAFDALQLYSLRAAADRFTPLGGDAELDGDVDLADFGVLRANFGSTTGLFVEADFNLDGLVDLADFGILRANFNDVADLAILDAWAATVPEPASLLLASAGGLLLRRRR